MQLVQLALPCITCAQYVYVAAFCVSGGAAGGPKSAPTCICPPIYVADTSGASFRVVSAEIMLRPVCSSPPDLIGESACYVCATGKPASAFVWTVLTVHGRLPLHFDIATAAPLPAAVALAGVETTREVVIRVDVVHGTASAAAC